MFNASGIEINKSSLVSLKAEILRKQQEIKINKQQEQPDPSRLFKSKKKSKTKHDEDTKSDSEDEEILARSKQMLESKAILYNSLSKRALNPTEEDKEITKHLLVQFDRKDNNQSDSDKEDNSYDYEESENPDEQFVEYTDFLGRTRKCLRQDLEHMKKQDRELSKNIDTQRKGVKKDFVKNTGEENEQKAENSNDNLSENNELVSSDMRRELLRREWEKQEEELLKKKDIHYQDILFNEARYHGAAYYAFSRNEEKRIKQQDELNKLRQETTKQQESIAEMRKLREKQMAARLKSARNRKRTRMGLSPEPEESENVEDEKHQSDEEKQKIDAEKIAEEKQKQIERSKIVRPWDIGKKIMKQHYEYSQEEWVKKQREQRPQEFAPPSTYSSNFHSKRNNMDSTQNETESKSLFFTTKRTKIRETNSDLAKQCSSTYNPSNLEDSVMAGLRFLREQTERQQWEDI